MFPVSDVIPSRRTPVVTIALIALISGAFLYQLQLNTAELRALLRGSGVVPAQFEWRAILTSLVVHAGWLHTAANATYLWIFGANVEDLLGRWRFLLLYGTCGAVSAITHLVMHPSSSVPLVGASGAVAGVIGAYLVLYPGSRVLTAFFPVLYMNLIEIPAVFYVPAWFLLQLVSGAASIEGDVADGTLAFWSHVGGFLTGTVCGTYSRFATDAVRHYWRR